MTFRDFLHASYALMAEEHQRINPLVDLLSVAERLTPKGARTETAPSQEDVAAKNQANLAALEAMGAAVGIKRLKPRRA